MSIPFSLKNSNAQNYGAISSNLTLSFLDKLTSSHCRFLPMQFAFKNNPSWHVNISRSSTVLPLKKISNIYIDAIDSTHDVIIYFPDTGYRCRVGAGTCFLFPSLVTRGSQEFYIQLLGNATSPTDIVNVFALDSTIPFFDTLWQYPDGLNGNKSTWMFVGKGNLFPGARFFNVTFYWSDGAVVLITPAPGFKTVLKHVNLSFNLVGKSPTITGSFLIIQLQIVEATAGITILTKNYSNTSAFDNGTICQDFFEDDFLNINYMSQGSNAIEYNFTIIQGAAFDASPTGSDNVVAFNGAFDYV